MMSRQPLLNVVLLGESCYRGKSLVGMPECISVNMATLFAQSTFEFLGSFVFCDTCGIKKCRKGPPAFGSKLIYMMWHAGLRVGSVG